MEGKVENICHTYEKGMILFLYKECLQIHEQGPGDPRSIAHSEPEGRHDVPIHKQPLGHGAKGQGPALGACWETSRLGTKWHHL